MRIGLDNLPVDTSLLHHLVRDMAAVVESRNDEIERLQLIIKKLQRAQFGRRSERLDPDQMALALEDLDSDVARVRESRPAIEASADETALSDQRQTNVRASVCDIACPDPSGYQAMSARHSPSAAERLCL